MLIEHTFEVPASPQETVDVLLDPEQVIPCMPGATLVEVVDERNWKVQMAVKLGPVAMTFDGDVHLADVDEDAAEAHLEITAREKRGKGGAKVSVDSSAVASDAGSRVDVVTDVRFSGQAAQLGRPNVVRDVSARMVDQFAECIAAQLTAASASAAAVPPPDAGAEADAPSKSGSEAHARAEAATAAAVAARARAQKPVSAVQTIRIAIVGALKRLFDRIRGHKRKETT